jgi:hypothetical protein
VLIVDRGRPAARLEPVTRCAEDAQGGRLSRLLRDGVKPLRRGDPPRALFSCEPPRVRAGAPGVDAVTRERRPVSLPVVTLDERLADTMRKEGFVLIDIAAE